MMMMTIGFFVRVYVNCWFVIVYVRVCVCRSLRGGGAGESKKTVGKEGGREGGWENYSACFMPLISVRCVMHVRVRVAARRRRERTTRKRLEKGVVQNKTKME
jgi:hypothetical protein